jgi:hypothetical protein
MYWTWNVCFDFLYNFEKFLIVRRIKRDIVPNVIRSSCKWLVFLVRFEWNLNFLDNYPKKMSNVQFHENPSSVRRVVLYGQRDGHAGKWTNRQKWRGKRSLFAIFRKRLKLSDN